ncbi:hypothetical protein BJ138DRAFT_1132530 [Hygrophoropsis aurantiaca]|uniref:Uncharacterized protein n=1 Tax=Hygrophoropsis aurantiaca TaxID=72124 RepID=A0ACB8AQJ7_9AGAM|nr:hypothetical protein BJ138DRAFT_1132530 [Hygrophoropsis aurantiaca]
MTSENVGAKKVEAAQLVYGRSLRWCLFIGLGLASYVYSLDASTTSAYLTFATSKFSEHSLIASIAVAQSIIVAVGKPAIAKIADVSSRGYAYLSVLIFYVLGYTIIGSAANVGTIAGGIVLYAVGLQLLTQIVIADVTTLAWRGLVSSLVNAPFLINAFIGSNISAAILKHASWRWGYGMFAILIPAALAPLIITLLWGEHRIKRSDIVQELESRPSRFQQATTGNAPSVARLVRLAGGLDLMGLVLLGASVSLVLLPLTLSQTVSGGWKNASLIVMLIIGIALLGVFLVWDLRVAKHPVISLRIVRNRSVFLASFIGFFDFVSFYLTFTYLYSFIVVVKPWSLLDATYFMQTQSVSLTFFGILAGVFMRFLRGYKHLLLIGLTIRLVGVALMLHSRGANGSTVELVWTQILQGIGGGFAAVSVQVGVQAAVPHADVAMIGGAVGNACAGAIWSNTMPRNLEKYLPGLTSEQRAAIYSSVTTAASGPRGDPVKEGVIQAYGDTMNSMVIAALVMSTIPIVLAFAMPNYALGDHQNAVDHTNLNGTTAEDEDIRDHLEVFRGQNISRAYV